MMRRTLITLLALTLLLCVSACSGDTQNAAVDRAQGGNAGENRAAPPTTASSIRYDVAEITAPVTEAPKPIAPDTQVIGEARAKEIALSHAGVTANEISYYDIDFDRDRGVDSYEIDFNVGRAEYEYDIDAYTGEIITAERDDNNILAPKPTEAAPTPSEPSLKTQAQAKAIALSHAGLNESAVRHFEIELDREDDYKNILVYEISFDANGYEYEYEINAETGNIINSEKEFDD